MSLESDLAAFHQSALDLQQQLNDRPEDEPVNLGELYNEYDSRLYDIIGEQIVGLYGVVKVPIMSDDYTHVEGSYFTADTVVGKSNGILIYQQKELVDDELEARFWCVGYSISISDEIVIVTNTFRTKIEQFAFGAVSSSYLSLPFEGMPDIYEIEPDETDIFANEIKKCLIDGVVDFTKLSEIFHHYDHEPRSLSLSNQTDMAFDYYENYANNMIASADVAIEARADVILFEHDDGSVSVDSSPEKGVYLSSSETPIIGVKFLPAANELCLAVSGIVNDEIVYAPISDLSYFSVTPAIE